MKSWSKDLENLKYYISAHNSQPLRLEIEDKHFKVFVNESKLLPVADPHHRDLKMSLGAFLRGLEIVLNSKAYAISDLKLSPPDDFKVPVASLNIISAPELEKSAAVQRWLRLMQDRFSFRGRFETAQPNSVIEAGLQTMGIYFSSEGGIKKQIAEVFDQTNLATLSRNDYLTELYSWMRFSRQHPRWPKDGLNAEGIGISGIEALGASVVLKPSVFSLLNSIGLGGALISEKAQITSAQYLVAFVAPKDADFVQQGRIFFEQWMNITELGLFGAPLSLLTEQESTVNVVKQALKIPANLQLVNILRCGPLPKGYRRYAPARLETADFIIER